MIKVLIASPGDLTKERIAAREVVEALRQQFRIQLEVWAWDDGTHLLDNGADTQKQIPEPESFDVVLCLFGTRIGKPMAEDFEAAKEYWIAGRPPTGTQYEYLRAVDPKRRRPRVDAPQAHRPFVRVYALTAKEANARLAPAPWSRRRDPEAEAQYGALCDFLLGAEGVGPRLVFEDFSDEMDLRARVRDDLSFLWEIDRNQTRLEELARDNERLSALYLAERSEKARPSDPALAVLIALEGLPKGRERPVVAEAGSALCRALAHDRLRAVLRGRGSSILTAVFTPDGCRVVMAFDDNTARIWDPTTDTETAALCGHDGPVHSAIVSPDGGHIMTAAGDGTARIWDGRTGAEIAVLRGPGDAVRIAAFHPDGGRAVTVSDGNGARIWNLWTGARIADLDEHVGSLVAPSFSPDGGRVVTAGRDTGRIWNSRTGDEIATLRGHESWITAAAFSPDGHRIVTASADSTARVWNAWTGTEVTVLRGHVDRVQAAAFSPDNHRIVTASVDNTARIWDVRAGSRISVLDGHNDSVVTAAFSPDGHRILTTSDDQSARIWDARTGAEIAALRGHDHSVTAAAFNAEGRCIVTRSDDGSVRTWDDSTNAEFTVFGGRDVSIETGRDRRPAARRSAVLRGNHETIETASFSPDGRRVLTTSQADTARIWDVETGDELAFLRGYEQWASTIAAFSPDGRRVVTASQGIARIWDAETGDKVAAMLGHGHSISTAAFSPDGCRIVTASDDKTARIWDATTGNEVAVLLGHEGPVSIAAFSPDGCRIVTGSSDYTVRIWDAMTGDEVAVLRGHQGWVSGAAFSLDGCRIVTASWDNTARTWDAMTGDEIAVMRGHASSILDPRAGAAFRTSIPTVWTAAFSPDGCRVVTASTDNTARIWHATTGAEIVVICGHEHCVRTAAFSPDGRRILTASDDGTARIWDAGSGAEIAILRGHENPLYSAAFSPDGRRILTASRDAARIWGTPAVASFSDRIAFARVTRARALTPVELRSLHLPSAAAPVLAGAAELASRRMLEAASLPSPSNERLRAFVMATALYEAAGDDEQARIAREKRAALAWLLPIADVAKVYREAVVELHALRAIKGHYGLGASDPPGPEAAA